MDVLETTANNESKNGLRYPQPDEVKTSMEENNSIENNSEHSMEVEQVISNNMEYENVDPITLINEISESITFIGDIENQSATINIGLRDGNNEMMTIKDVDSIKNAAQTNEIVPITNDLFHVKTSPNKNFTLPYRGINGNGIYQPLVYIQLCNECKEEIKDKFSHLSWECLDFCNEDCLAKYQRQIGKQCANCSTSVTLASLGKYCVRFGSDIRQFCQSKCLDAFKKVHKVCCYCQTFIAEPQTIDTTIVNDSTQLKNFCTQQCMEKYYKMNQYEKPNSTALCDVCRNEKVIRVEIEVDDTTFKLCSEPCFVAFKFANNIVTEQCTMCRKYYEQITLEYTIHLNDQQVLNFCCKTCLNIYVITNRKIVDCDWCKVKKYNFDMIQKQLEGNNGLQKLTVCSFNCLNLCKLSLESNPIECSMNSGSSNHFVIKDAVDIITNTYSQSFTTPAQLQHRATKSQSTSPVPELLDSPKYIQHVIVQPPAVCQMKNKTTMCKPVVHTKGISFKSHVHHKYTQTDYVRPKSLIVPIPIPIYVPTPMVNVSAPFPIPTPFPLPVPVPVFIPTTRSTTKGILKEMQKIQARVPSDPYEAEVLMMAEMVACDNRIQTDSENEEDDPHPLPVISDDILQLALNMTTNETRCKQEPQDIIDLEGALITNTITVSQESEQPTRPTGGKQRGKRYSTKLKKDLSTIKIPTDSSARDYEVINTDDANMSLKYSYGVNAWKQWVQTKQNDFEKQPSTYYPTLSNRFMNKMKTDLLQLSADELNYSLALFISEYRKPNNTEYAPDTIYYLCLGIQYYLYKHNRCDNIFTDIFYENFTECLNKIAKMFSVIHNDSNYIVTRVEEEHLWECKQLGAHSPHVLLNSLIFFNTKYFNLSTVEDHMHLSFAHIMKHWKRNHSNTKNSGGSSVSAAVRNVLLRYYPPTSSASTSSELTKSVKKVYEQEENEENPLRCPVKLYEFYLSKCPESVKTRNDVFYLSPERSCLPDSPVWYSTSKLDRHALEKMLYRIKMVKEINVALLRG